MDLRVLGPVEVLDRDISVPIGGPRQRLVLALLILDVGETVPTDRLINDVWEDEPPEAARRTVQAYVSNLRRELEAVRPGTLVAHSPGYALTVSATAIDARRFEDAVDEGRSLIEGNPAEAAAVLREGLSLWRGTPYADLAGAIALRPEITRLEELRCIVIELRVDADLALGRHGLVIGELETLVADHPLSERFAIQLMLALYRAGRQAEALRVAQCTRTTLGEELGIDPSPDLRDLEHSILDHDPALDLRITEQELPPDDVQSDVIRGFEIRRHIGGSHWAQTYVAYQRSLQREVVLQVINPLFSRDNEFMERFQASVVRMIRVDHPNIVPFYDTWRDSDGAYIVRHYFPRGSLKDALTNGTWDPADTPRLVAQIGSALEAVHRNGIVHANLKASHIMLDADSNAYITDFSLPAAMFAGEEAFLAHRRADGSRLSDDELLSEPTPQLDIRGLSTVARVLLDGTNGCPGVSTVLERGTSVDPSNQYASIAEFVDALVGACGDVGASDVSVSHNPYKGLKAFGEADAGDFFGREELVSSLVSHLAASDRGCLVLVGASGIGKSSIVNAGLLPAVRDGAIDGSNRWHVVKMHPGVHPYGELAGALRQVAAEPDPRILGHLTWGEIGIGEALSSTFADPAGEVLLVIDQFEELFTLIRDEAVRASFIESLVDAVDDPDVHVRLVLTLRADFYDRPLRYPRLAALLAGCMVTVIPMTEIELERAITEPARRVGAELDPGLAGRIVDDVRWQPGMLPLVQYALTDLFERRNGNRITAAAYDRSGGIRGPLAARSEETYLALDVENRSAARQVFLHLVVVDEDGRTARRRVQRSELTSIVGHKQAASTVIDSFGAARLLSFDRHPVTRSPTVEIAHDALLTKWGRLREWIDDHRSDVRLHQRLGNATTDWVSSGRTPDFLLVGGQLHRLAGWAKGTDLALSDIEQSYLDESIAASETEELEERERIEHEHELEDRSRRRLRMLTVVWMLTGLVAVLAVFAFAQWQRSEYLAKQTVAIAAADDLAAMSHNVRAGDPELALLLALLAVETTLDVSAAPTVSAYNALIRAIRKLDTPSPEAGRENVFGVDLAEIIDLARSNLTRGLTHEECVALGLGSCPMDTIASPLDP